MNIYAISGHIVRCKTFDAGYQQDKELAQKHLELLRTYTIDFTNVDRYHTTVYLKEIPNVGFNSVFFDDVTPQYEYKDKQHKDYYKYNR